MKILLDPGHGAPDPGAIGPTGLTEASVVRKVAHAAAMLLAQAGLETNLTCYGDSGMALDLRGDMANAWGADALVSIHCNAATNPAARGIEAWTTPGQTKADGLAEALLVALGRAFPGEPIRRDTADGDGDKEGRLRVLVKARAPAVLVELGFISHPETEAAMRSPSWISAAAGAIATGVANWKEARA